MISAKATITFGDVALAVGGVFEITIDWLLDAPRNTDDGEEGKEEDEMEEDVERTLRTKKKAATKTKKKTNTSTTQYF